MTDLAKNSEIEDVLSSIRRLVSENHAEPAIAAPAPAAAKPAAPEPAIQDEPAPAKPHSDRLVLSPSLRILDEPEAEEEVAEVEQTSPVADTPFVNSLKEDILPLRENLPQFLRDRANTLDSSDRQSVAETEETQREETLVSEPASLEPVENTVQFPAPETLTFETARTSDLAPAADRTEEPFAESPTSKANPRPWEIEGERIAEWHSVRTEDAEDNFEPDGPEDGDNAAVPVEALNWEDHETEEAVVPETPVTEAVSEPIDPPVSETADPVADHIAEHVAQDVATAPLAVEGDTIDAQQYEAVLDEEMLRELVGEIVRQELQGPLGERITRNVRKLVRREINRALTARSFNDE